ncbi:ABC transporter permease [Pseudoruegeria sp. HB172150]|uniref:ABC transporter permease n=1 Tax=Pseudoruegeria sp. HB172150 TaxID=2721164 RepID=UPI00155603F6|nr:ABC transporter permease [Pseudoruegeria sp. HB172150]
MAVIAPVKTPPLQSFTLPLSAVVGALFGLLVGIANEVSLIGLFVGAVFGAALSYMLVTFVPKKNVGKGAAALICAVAGLVVAGFAGLVAGAIIGWIMGWFVYWLHTGKYRASVPPFYTPGQVLWHNSFKFICGLIFFFLIAPIVTIMPLSFNAEDFFTFTPGMLALDPAAFSLKHYQDFFTNPDWQQALRNSVKIAPAATILSVSLGTLAAIGLSQPHVPFRRAIMAILISPMIVPLIISAAGMYFFYSRIGLQGTYVGVVLAHAALGIPFVIITVTATLVGFDDSLTRAAANMGANPVRTFFKVQMPLILPGVISGGLFAFITSFDEVVVVLFVGSAGQKTLPWQMFTGLREQISPTILAVATILVAISIVLLTTVELLRRRSERLRGMSPG